MGRVAYGAAVVSVLALALGTVRCSEEPGATTRDATSGSGGSTASSSGRGSTVSVGTTTGAGGAASWVVVDWELNCDGEAEVALPEHASKLLPPLEWEACSGAVTCQQWRVLHDAALIKPVRRASVQAAAAQVGVVLDGKQYRTTAVYDLVTGEPLAGWRSRFGALCAVADAVPMGTRVWTGAQQTSNMGNSAQWFVKPLAGEEYEAPFTQTMVRRWASEDLMVGRTLSNQLVAWNLTDDTESAVSAGDLGTDANITEHGVFYRQATNGNPPEVWRWDPITKLREVVASPPPNMGTVSVEASSNRLWWSVGELAQNGPGFAKVELYTAPLPLVGPLPMAGNFVADLSVKLGDDEASDSFYAYHDNDLENGQTIRVLEPGGAETTIPIPPEANGVLGLDFVGNDGQVPKSIWFYAGNGMFRLSLP